MVFFGISSTLIDDHTLPGQTEGLKVGCGGMGGRRDGRALCEVWVDRWAEEWFAKVDNVFLRLGGFAKVDNRFVYEKWLQGGSIGL